MYTMLEVVGVAPDSFSQAVKNALTIIHNQGHVASWFEVMEQRGLVSNNNVKQFQVKIKVGVAMGSAEQPASSSSTSSSAETCPTCAQPSGEHGHMCSPKPVEDSTCEWCGAQITDARHMCDEKTEEIAYICNTCGRAAISPDQVCDPKKLKK